MWLTSSVPKLSWHKLDDTDAERSMFKMSLALLTCVYSIVWYKELCSMMNWLALAHEVTKHARLDMYKDHTAHAWPFPFPLHFPSPELHCAVQVVTVSASIPIQTSFPLLPKTKPHLLPPTLPTAPQRSPTSLTHKKKHTRTHGVSQYTIKHVLVCVVREGSVYVERIARWCGAVRHMRGRGRHAP